MYTEELYFISTMARFTHDWVCIKHHLKHRHKYVILQDFFSLQDPCEDYIWIWNYFIKYKMLHK